MNKRSFTSLIQSFETTLYKIEYNQDSTIMVQPIVQILNEITNTNAGSKSLL